MHLAMLCLIKFPTIGALSSVNPPYNHHQLPNRGVVGHNTDRRIIGLYCLLLVFRNSNRLPACLLLFCLPHFADQSRTRKVGEMTGREREGNALLLKERKYGEEKSETATTTF